MHMGPNATWRMDLFEDDLSIETIAGKHGSRSDGKEFTASSGPNVF